MSTTAQRDRCLSRLPAQRPCASANHATGSRPAGHRGATDPGALPPNACMQSCVCTPRRCVARRRLPSSLDTPARRHSGPWRRLSSAASHRCRGLTGNARDPSLHSGATCRTCRGPGVGASPGRCSQPEPDDLRSGTEIAAGSKRQLCSLRKKIFGFSLRNDEGHICARSAQPLRVPADRSACDTSSPTVSLHFSIQALARIENPGPSCLPSSLALE